MKWKRSPCHPNTCYKTFGLANAVLTLSLGLELDMKDGSVVVGALAIILSMS
jgi:hypothetical protein